VGVAAEACGAVAAAVVGDAPAGGGVVEGGGVLALAAARRVRNLTRTYLVVAMTTGPLWWSMAVSRWSLYPRAARSVNFCAGAVARPFRQ
jgi:hypothetical protein